jgi:hypothetical protein
MRTGRFLVRSGRRIACAGDGLGRIQGGEQKFTRTVGRVRARRLFRGDSSRDCKKVQACPLGKQRSAAAGVVRRSRTRGGTNSSLQRLGVACAPDLTTPFNAVASSESLAAGSDNHLSDVSVRTVQDGETDSRSCRHLTCGVAASVQVRTRLRETSTRAPTRGGERSVVLRWAGGTRSVPEGRCVCTW